MFSVYFQAKPFNVTVIQVYSPTINAEETEFEQFYEDLQDLLVQFSSVTQLCPAICDPMASSTPGYPVHHPLLELAQIHVHQVGDGIQPSHPLAPPSLPTFSQHQGVF